MSAAGIRRALGLSATILFALVSYGCSLEVNVQDQRDQTDHSRHQNTYEEGDTNSQGGQN